METVKILDKVAFDDKRQTRQRLIMSDRIEMEMVCYEPGQHTIEHHHVGQDEIFIIMDGRGAITVDGETTRVERGSAVFAPADVKHSVETDEDSRMVMVFVKAPGRGTRPGRAKAAAAS